MHKVCEARHLLHFGQIKILFIHEFVKLFPRELGWILSWLLLFLDRSQWLTLVEGVLLKW